MYVLDFDKIVTQFQASGLAAFGDDGWFMLTPLSALAVIPFLSAKPDIGPLFMTTATINGTEDDDFLEGTAAFEEINGFGGDDGIYAGAGDDVVNGGDGDDFIFGGDGDDMLNGDAGNDNITGNEGADTIDGGAGSDRLDGSEGDDVILGGAGDDTISRLYFDGSDQIDGGDGVDTVNYLGDRDEYTITVRGDGTVEVERTNRGETDSLINVEFLDFTDERVVLDGTGVATVETLTGSSAADFLEGTAAFETIDGLGGNDSINAEAGDDIVDGGDGNDAINGGDGFDELNGGAGNDFIDGGEGEDFIDGGAGADAITGGEGDDVVLGGEGDDTISRLYFDGSDQIDGGGGLDTISYLGNRDEYAITERSDGTVEVERINRDETDSLINVEYLDFADERIVLDDTVRATIETLIGTSGTDFINGTAAFEQIDGLGGNDFISAGAGDDVVDGGDGTDSIQGGDGEDRLDGGAGDDSINGGKGIDFIEGGSGNDTLNGGEGDDVIIAGAGNDTITRLYFDGSDQIDGGEGTDTVNYLGNRDEYTITERDDGTFEVERINRGEIDSLINVEFLDFDDERVVLQEPSTDRVVVNGTSENDTINGTAAFEEINGLGGDDVISAAAGDDIVNGGDGNDIITGGDGEDELNGDAGNDNLSGGEGADILSGGDGSDQFVGNEGDDIILGGAGDDAVFRNYFDGSDQIDGGDGYDTVTYLGSRDEYTITERSDGTVEVERINRDEIDSLINVEVLDFADERVVLDNTLTATIVELNGTPGRDSIFGTAAFEIINAFGGDDFILAGSGDDVVNGGSGADRISGGSGQDELNGDDGGDVIDGNGGEDTIFGGAGADRINGGEGDDVIFAGSGDDTISRLYFDGSDQVDGGSGIDTINYLGDRDEYDITVRSDGTVEVERINRNETDSLINVEFLDFADERVILSEGREDNRSVINGSQESDFVIGTDADQTISTAGGDDFVSAGGGNDVINGQAGSDELLGDAGNDGILGDGFVYVDASSLEAQVFRAYQAVLGRVPDAGGYAATLDALQNGALSQAQVVDNFVASAEFAATYGELDNEGFVRLLYQNVLEREADAEGLAAFVGDLDSGALSRAEAVLFFANSDEFIRTSADDLAVFTTQTVLNPYEGQTFRAYQAVFDRAPDEGGFTAVIGALEAGALTLEQVIVNFVASDEFQATYGELDNTAFIDTLFENVLPDNEDAAGQAAFVAELDAGNITRAEAVLALSESLEFQEATDPDALAFRNAVFVNNSDILDGGTGNDSLVGGRGSDRFLFDADDGGSDNVRDFTLGVDTLQIAAGTAFDTFEEIIAAGQQQGADTVFDFGDGNSLRLFNVQLDALSQSDFRFDARGNAAETLDDIAKPELDPIAELPSLDTEAEPIVELDHFRELGLDCLDAGDFWEIA